MSFKLPHVRGAHLGHCMQSGQEEVSAKLHRDLLAAFTDLELPLSFAIAGLECRIHANTRWIQQLGRANGK